MNIDNQQQSSDEENVQRLSSNGVHAACVETGDTLPCNDEGKDIVHKINGLSRRKNRDIENEKIVFLSMVYEKHGNKFSFDLTDYDMLTRGKISITCPIHGTFKQTPVTFMQKGNLAGCPKCGMEHKNKSKTQSYDNFLEKAIKIHNNKYIYPEENRLIYKNRKSKIKIVCKEHGEFIKSGQKHLSGQGCFKCNIKSLIKEDRLVGGYSEKLFQERPELKITPAILYYLKINDGVFYKIGITVKSIKDRIKGLRCKAKHIGLTFETVWYIEDSLYNCYIKEQEILKNYKKFRIYESWSSELFNTNILPLKLTQIS